MSILFITIISLYLNKLNALYLIKKNCHQLSSYQGYVMRKHQSQKGAAIEIDWEPLQVSTMANIYAIGH